MEQNIDGNYLISIKKYNSCIEREVNTCGADILKHFIPFMKADEEHYKDGNGEFGKMLGEIPVPRAEL